jgi:hypothetical protein
MGLFAQISSVYICQSGYIGFVSDAPLELIEAESENLTGALDISSRSFSFSIPTVSFQGFNSSMQRTHFNEDFMESDLYPNSTFKGRIIEEVDLTVPGEHIIRAKGKLTIHGIEADRIIRCILVVNKDNISVNAEFTVFLDDHSITIPSILNRKIAEEIRVEVELILLPG